jgi:predicted transcriptional regulator
MSVLYRRGRVSAAHVQKEIPHPPGYSTVRKLLEILEKKGHIRHEVEGPRYVYSPTVSLEQARESALLHLVQTFFDGSLNRASAALLALRGRKPTAKELDRVSRLADEAEREGR